MDFFEGLIAFVFGAIVGSFLNVVILRYGSGRGFSGRSGCFSCGKKLKTAELVPILSFIFLCGRCSLCKAKISWQYPLVEFLTAVIFMLVVGKDFLLGETLVHLAALSVLMAITIYDLRHKIIPDGLSLIFAFTALTRTIFFPPITSLSGMEILSAFLAGPLTTSPFFFIWFFSRGRWMGLGDAKLALGIGWLLGIGSALFALLLSFWIGAFVSVSLLALGKIFQSTKGNGLFSGLKNLTMKSEVPFAPFLVFGTFLALLLPFDIFSFFAF